MKAFGVFEGGGVRGYAHLGALKACEDRGVTFVGVSGTSIGAIVAALVAAGYTSTDLYEVNDYGEETGLFAIDVVEQFLDPVEHKRLERLRKWRERGANWRERVAIRMRRRVASSAWSQGVARKISTLKRRASGSLAFASVAVPPLYTLGLPLAACHWKLLRSVYRRSGVLDGDAFAAWLNARLAERLGLPDGTIVTFADLPMPLACIATNLSRGEMTVFKTASHPDTSVAEAAMASAAYPLVFKPRLIEGDAYVDGGPLSNFPAWTLDVERADEATILPTFGFRVVDATVGDAKAWPGDGEPGLPGVLRRIIAAAMWGRGDLESRRIDDLHPMRVETAVKATDFHDILDRRVELYRAGHARVQAYFKRELGPRDPDEMQGRLRTLCDLVRNVVSASGIVRAYLVQPVDDRFARVVYSAFYEGDADDALLFRRGSASQALCFDRREPILMRATELDDAARRSPATKLIHALRPPHVTHVYAIPLFGDPDAWANVDPSTRPEPIASLCFDFEDADDRLLLDPEIEDTLAAIADGLVDLWRDRSRPGLGWLSPGEEQAPSGDWTALPQTGCYVSARKSRARPFDDRMAQIGAASM
ncbi:patatin-like phospholipase family protein [Methylobacterium sp. E-016]|uniref:patatin-like phospholipase family protein n=1 Tax=Methylobacterium sp. E-016 TaxID=2836556 RepID=UPI001FBB3826|nr:patatin-like phospholipase family protein [Methylobacterium sp. E-016]MCJ2075980.1 patatin-like phospholipase family protein [Methylobacterium sp. E-016]